MRSARRLATSWMSSRRRTVKLAGLKKCLRAFWEARALPSVERGPVDLAALARLAAVRSAEMGGFAIGFLRFRFKHKGRRDSGDLSGKRLMGKGKIRENFCERKTGQSTKRRGGMGSDSFPAGWANSRRRVR